MYVNGLNFDFSIHDDEDICKKSKLLIQHLPKTPMQSMYADQVEKVFTTQRLKNYSAGFNHAEWWRTDWGRRTTCWVKNRCCPVPDRNWPVQWPPHHSPALLASLPGWSSGALGISCWAYFKVLCILADYRHSGHASLFISHEKTGWPLLESPSRNSKWSHHGIKQQSRSIVTLRSIDLTVRSRSIAPMEDDIGLLAPHSW